MPRILSSPVDNFSEVFKFRLSGLIWNCTIISWCYVHEKDFLPDWYRSCCMKSKRLAREVHPLKESEREKMKTIKNLAGLAVIVLLVAGVSAPVHADLITVDQILYKLNPVGGLSPEQAANLSATVDMTFTSVDGTHGLLTVTLTNTSGLTTGTTPSASNLLSGIGFNLPEGVSVVDNATYNSSIALPAGSSAFGGTFSQTVWGWGTTIGGHYDDPGVLGVNLILSTNTADTSTTFGGDANLDGPTWGLQSATGSPTNSPYIKPSISFSIYLAYASAPSNLLQYIQSGAVVVEYGSPADAQGQITPPSGKVPEPMTLILYGLGFAGAGVYTRIRRRK